jgi:hypothetical protein
MSLSAKTVIAVSLVLAAGEAAVAQEETVTVEELWAIVQAQQAQISELRDMLDDTDTRVEETADQLAATEQQVAATGDFVESLAVPESSDTTIGAYGEMHYNHLGAEGADLDTERVDYHRFVGFLSHRFNDRLSFFSEIELEHSIAGDGQPGEVELEQAYLDFALNDRVSAQAGLFLVPVGILNETHEPPTFYGVERNDVESVIIPSTWWEAGGNLRGRISNGLSWDVAVHSGLEMPTTGSSAFRVRSGRQKVAEALASDNAYTLRVRYTGQPGLELGASFQYQADPSQVAGDGLDSGRLITTHGIYQRGDFDLRALYAQWRFDGAAVEAAGVDEQTGWYLEPSYRLSERWGIYSRYEDVEGAREQDQFTQWEAGFNFWPTGGVVLKFDYRQRDHDLVSQVARDFDGFDLGVGYQF